MTPNSYSLTVSFHGFLSERSEKSERPAKRERSAGSLIVFAHFSSNAIILISQRHILVTDKLKFV